MPTTLRHGPEECHIVAWDETNACALDSGGFFEFTDEWFALAFARKVAADPLTRGPLRRLLGDSTGRSPRSDREVIDAFARALMRGRLEVIRHGGEPAEDPGWGGAIMDYVRGLFRAPGRPTRSDISSGDPASSPEPAPAPAPRTATPPPAGPTEDNEEATPTHTVQPPVSATTETQTDEESAATDDDTEEVVSLEWNPEEAWCGDKIKLKGTTRNYADGTKLKVEIETASGTAVTELEVEVAGDAFEHEWEFTDVYPEKEGETVQADLDIVATCEGKNPDTPLVGHFLPTVDKREVTGTRDHKWNVGAENTEMQVTAEMPFLKGWAGQVVKLDPDAAGNPLPGTIAGLWWDGYYWMIEDPDTGSNVYWDGCDWKPLPRGFRLIDANNFCVGFYKNGDNFTCQYGDNWPEVFEDYDINAAAHQRKLTAWKDDLNATWSGTINLRRESCPGKRRWCCTYTTKTAVTFAIKDAHEAGVVMLAEGDIRSNDSLFFLGEPRIKLVAHEWGHHIDNPDEYAGARIDVTMNTDGAVNGLDNTSLMGSLTGKVKKRHFGRVADEFSSTVSAANGSRGSYVPEYMADTLGREK